MVSYSVHTIESAPEDSKALLRGLETNVGMIPNLAAAMAESPHLLEGFLRTREILSRGTFTPGEIQVLALTNAFENGCRYCMSLHSSFARKEGVSSGAIEALRAGVAPEEPKLRALSNFSRKLIQERGAVGARDVSEFVTAGHTKAQVLEVVLGVAMSILPNFAHHITGCPIDDVFQSHLWEMTAR
jgi:AhpD family alkylhydroperoxidase